ACETLVTTGLAVIAGEITTDCYVDFQRVVRQVIKDVGYTRAKYGFDSETCSVLSSIHEQSRDIGQGVDTGGAGDQGLMFGYACTETPELMPLPIQLAHTICRRLADVRKAGILPYLRPDGKSQVTVRYRSDDAGHRVPVGIERLLVSTQHDEGSDPQLVIKPDLIEHVLRPTLPRELYEESRFDDPNFFLVNPTGKFVTGGPMGDTGLTGRKIIVDTYGGAARHGGGAFSGKDPTKVDRSAAYAARYVAKNIVAAGLAERCEVQISYAIGVAQPFSVDVECFGTERIAEGEIGALVREYFDLRPAAILADLDLLRPIYAKTAAYGHFGRSDPDFTWERTDKAEALCKAAGLPESALRMAPSMATSI
ncbi:MAG: methionine adenosyltransferase, partial [Acidimicrobiia bacterium]